PDRPGKKHPLDCLLWRVARPGEPAWDGGALGSGRPGWHIECTTIALEWRSGEAALFAVFVADTGLLTMLLAGSGGDSSPFALLYVFPVAVGALLVRPALTWALYALATACYASLFWLAPANLHDHGPQAMHAHLVGMFVAYALTAGLMAFAVGRVRAERALADARLAEVQQIEARNQRLASLATLAAGAAHELMTPLSTILVVAGELERSLVEPRHREDLALVREEVARCREIVASMSADVGTARGEATRPIGLRALLASALDDEGVRVTADDAVVAVPVDLIGQVIRRLVGNARDAAGPDGEITVTGRKVDDRLEIVVADRGPGMAPDVLIRATEPFFTTKDAGLGRGLGLYFVDSVVTQLGGQLQLVSAVGRGTTVTLHLPQEQR
ncbi:MAG: ATP-binding protein, partial [Myxococcota bacterium]